MPLGALGLLFTAACGEDGTTDKEQEFSDVAFATHSGDVADLAGTASINLALTAPADDPVWDGIHEFHVVNDAPNGGDLVLAGDSVELDPGDEVGDDRVGAVLVDIPDDVQDLELSTVRVMVDEGGTLEDHDVGDWSFHRNEAESALSPTHDYPASAAGCGEQKLNLSADHGPGVDIVDVAIDAPGVDINDVQTVRNSTGNGGVDFDVSFTLDCDHDAYDVFAVSPRITVGDGGNVHEEALAPILLGYMDLTEEDVQRFRDR